MARDQNALGVPSEVLSKLQLELPNVATLTVSTILAEVPGYADAFEGPLGGILEEGVTMALGGFLRIASRSTGSDPGTPLQPALDAAYQLGRGEAKRGSTTDSLLAAYRVGARISWRELSRIAVDNGTPATTLAQFAELVFAYIDELSAASVFGHAEELASSSREHERQRERLVHNLLAGESADVLRAAADLAQWRPPQTLTAVLVSGARARGLPQLADARNLQLTGGLPGLDADDDRLVMLVADVDGAARVRLGEALEGRDAVLGPARPWQQVGSSYRRALRTSELGGDWASEDPRDSERHLTELILTADPDALKDLRTQVLEPLSALRPAAAEKLAETLRVWLLHQGRREGMAAAMFVHPQTVRYRMGQLRELYGDRLDDPEMVLAASVALGIPSVAYAFG
jgi:hypothetical protein